MAAKDNSVENKLRIAGGKFIAAIRKAVQNVSPEEALEIWMFIKTIQMKHLGLTDGTQIKALVETQANEMGAKYITAAKEDWQSVEHNGCISSLETIDNPAGSTDSIVPEANGTFTKGANASK